MKRSLYVSWLRYEDLARDWIAVTRHRIASAGGVALFVPEDEDKFRRHIAQKQTLSPATRLKTRRRILSNDDIPPEDEFPREDEFASKPNLPRRRTRCS